MQNLEICSDEFLERSLRPDLSNRHYDKVESGKHSTDRNVALKDMSRPSRLTCTTMWSWFEPVSPHLAAEREEATVSDSCVLDTVTASLRSFAQTGSDIDDNSMPGKWAIVETAGGVASPGPSGTLQCDLYRYYFW
jgi:dethiobiotin synthetase